MPSRIVVEGFKSIGDRVDVEIRPLTLLAGANSSGKSSVMQAILLLKQTSEAPFDPGVLLLNGPNVKFTSFDQLLHVGRYQATKFTVGIYYDNGQGFETLLRRSPSSKKVEVESCQITVNGRTLNLHPDVDLQEIQDRVVQQFQGLGNKFTVRLNQNRFTLTVEAIMQRGGVNMGALSLYDVDLSPLERVIHVPGLRGNPERNYPLSATGPGFPGTFERYTASLISSWTANAPEKLNALGSNLEKLGLTWRVEANNVDDAFVELLVGRLPRPTEDENMVSIADVGFGVSQALPVLVALLEASPGQFVFIEQPEIHLHPRAQTALAGILADAAKRGVKLVIETHSSLLLLAIQTLVAEGDLDPNLVKLHWFTRDPDSGSTQITSADLDDAGRFGDWPEDFDNVTLEAQSRYLDAVEAAVVKE